MEDRHVIVIPKGMDCYVFVYVVETASEVSPKAGDWAANPDLPSFRWSDAAVAAKSATMKSEAQPHLRGFTKMILRALDKDRVKKSQIPDTA